jgi:hypothetical protein
VRVSSVAAPIQEEDLLVLERKLMQLKLDYERYFLGTRPREPVMLRGEVHKQITLLANTAIPNTALRFKFGSIVSRYQSFQRRWNETLRQIEQGTYSRHRFKAGLHEEERAAAAPAAPSGRRGGDLDELYEAYVEARRSCGQSADLTPEALRKAIAQQESALRERFGGGSYRFKVVVEDGRARLKASRVER